MEEMDVHNDSTLKGQRFGRWTLTGNYIHKNGPKYVEGICDCGKKKYIREYTIKKGESTSCGCYRSELTISRQAKHGESMSCRHKCSRLYHIWCGMKDRVCNPNSKNSKRYSQRGISICEEWKNSYPAFKAWALSNGYADDLSIDRIDNDGPYSPKNCRWTDAETQMNNRCTNRIIEAFGEKHTISQWARKYDLSAALLRSRLNNGWDTETALTKPVQKKREKKC